ncbi:restriction endonuclease [uncultured Draconibacterium sp.]|uniref:restriction endonuclease n=1 Tax=uncultured Draconibacterium sp. TaxID=1573823 RepID=UPI0032174DB4
MKNRTINEAILDVFKREGKPLLIKDIYKRIIEYDLYRFRAQRPEDIVRIQLRRHCAELDFPTASSKKLFTINKDGAFFKLEKKTKQLSGEKKDNTSTFDDLKVLHKKYVHNFKKDLLKQLKELSPTAFEEFGKKLMTAYGFKKMEVTRKSRDGGIDGFGELKIGLASMKVAFECKRWTRNTVGRPQVSQFRGDIQGKYQQGIYFTTSTFSKEAKESSFQTGAVPIILLDGYSIVDLMIEKQFGVDVEEIPVYSNALDLVLTD